MSNLILLLADIWIANHKGNINTKGTTDLVKCVLGGCLLTTNGHRWPGHVSCYRIGQWDSRLHARDMTLCCVI